MISFSLKFSDWWRALFGCCTAAPCVPRELFVVRMQTLLCCCQGEKKRKKNEYQSIKEIEEELFFIANISLFSVGHLLEQGWTQERNDSLLSELAYLFLGNHDVAPVVEDIPSYIPAADNEENDRIMAEKNTPLSAAVVAAELQDREELPLVPDAEMISVNTDFFPLLFQQMLILYS